MAGFLGGWLGTKPLVGAMLGAVVATPSIPDIPTTEAIVVNHAQVAFNPAEDGMLVVCLSEQYTVNANSTLLYRVRLKRTFDYGESNMASWTLSELVANSASYGAVATDIQSGFEFIAFFDRSDSVLKIKRRKWGGTWEGPWNIATNATEAPLVLEMAFDKSRRLVCVYEASGGIWRIESRDGGENWTNTARVVPVTAPTSTNASLLVLPEDWVEFVSVWEEANGRWALYRSTVASMKSESTPVFELVSYIVTEGTSSNGRLEWAEGEPHRLVFLTWNTTDARIDRYSSFDSGVHWGPEKFKDIG